jgi:hypothetical protein
MVLSSQLVMPITFHNTSSKTKIATVLSKVSFRIMILSCFYYPSALGWCNMFLPSDLMTPCSAAPQRNAPFALHEQSFVGAEEKGK